MVKMVEILYNVHWPILISRKIWETETFCFFHTLWGSKKVSISYPSININLVLFYKITIQSDHWRLRLHQPRGLLQGDVYMRFIKIDFKRQEKQRA